MILSNFVQMLGHVSILPLFFVFFFFLMQVSHGLNIPPCNQLPYPQACHSSFDRHHRAFLAGEKPAIGIRDLTLQAAVEHAKAFHLLAASSTAADHRMKAVWDDCAALAEDTVDMLLRSTTSSSNDDSQTWLSAAIANQHTCLDGFRDFNLTAPSEPFVNAREALSNALAMDKALLEKTVFTDTSEASVKGNYRRRLLPSTDSGHGGTLFPGWMTKSDRRMLCNTSSAKRWADLIVAKDGTGNFTTINDAVAAVVGMRKDDRRFVVYVKTGVYAENVEITKDMVNVTFLGDGKYNTIVTGSKNVVDGSTTFRSATFVTVGTGFIAKGMTFENTAGPEKYQAVALRSGADLSVFYRCRFKGYQDTLYVHSQRQFYRECDVYGTIDFIFGDAVAILQNCTIYVRKPLSKQKNTITAQGRTDPNENTGISIHESRITAAYDLRPELGNFQTFLGRPWKEYSRTVFMECTLDGLIAPTGWLEWDGNFALSTLYYGEYNNTGEGADTSRRVNWPGYRVITNVSEASRFTVASFLDGGSWLPATDVPFNLGLD